MTKETIERREIETAADLRFFLDQIEAHGINPADVYLGSGPIVGRIVASTLTDGSIVHDVELAEAPSPERDFAFVAAVEGGTILGAIERGEAIDELIDVNTDELNGAIEGLAERAAERAAFREALGGPIATDDRVEATIDELQAAPVVDRNARPDASSTPPARFTVDNQPYGTFVLEGLAWGDYNGFPTLIGTVVEGSETSRIGAHASSRSIVGERRTVYGVTVGEVLDGRCVRIAC